MRTKAEESSVFTRCWRGCLCVCASDVCVRARASDVCVCMRFRCVCVRALQMCVCACASDVCACARFRCVCVRTLQMCVRACASDVCVCASDVCVRACASDVCACVRFRCVCVRALQMCVCARFRCVRVRALQMCVRALQMCVRACASDVCARASVRGKLLTQRSTVTSTIPSVFYARLVLSGSPYIESWYVRLNVLVVMHRRTFCENVDRAKIKVTFYKYRYFNAWHRCIVSIYRSISMNRYTPNVHNYIYLCMYIQMLYYIYICYIQFYFAILPSLTVHIKQNPTACLIGDALIIRCFFRSTVCKRWAWVSLLHERRGLWVFCQ